MIHVEDIMSKQVFTVHPDDPVSTAAQLMWDHDCGCVPVVDARSHVVGIMTDRDICMAAFTQGKCLHEITVSSACATLVYTCHDSEPLSHAESLMVRAQVRRLPVVDSEGALVGMLSLSDLARHMALRSVSASNSVAPLQAATVLEAVSRPRLPATALEPLSAVEAARVAAFDSL